MNFVFNVWNSFFDGCVQALRGYRELALTINRFICAGGKSETHTGHTEVSTASNAQKSSRHLKAVSRALFWWGACRAF